MKNYTPHEVVIALDEGQEIRIPAQASPLRLAESDTPGNPLEWADRDDIRIPLEVPTVQRSFFARDLPEPGGTSKLVALPVLMALAERGIYRDDLFAPDTGKSCLRDERGQIKAVTRLVRLSPPRAYSPRARLLEIASFGMFDGSQPAHFPLYIGADGWLYPGRFPGWHGGFEPEPLPEQMEKEVREVIRRLAHNPGLIGENGCAQGVRTGLGNDEQVYPLQERLARRAAHMLSDRLSEPVAVCVCNLDLRAGCVVGESEVSLMHWQISAGTAIGTEEGGIDNG